MMKILRNVLCAALLLVAGLSGCEKMFPEIGLAGNLEGDWQKVNPERVQQG